MLLCAYVCLQGAFLNVSASEDYSLFGQYDFSIYDEYEEDYYIPVAEDGTLRVNGNEYLIPNNDFIPWGIVKKTDVIYEYVYLKDGVTYSSTNSAFFPCDTPYLGYETNGAMHVNLHTDDLLKSNQPYDIIWNINLVGVENFSVNYMRLVGQSWMTQSMEFIDFEILYQDANVCRVKFDGVEFADTTHIVYLNYNMTPNATNMAVYVGDIDISESSSSGFFSSIIEWVKGIYNSIVELPTRVATFIGDKLHELFIPTQSQMRAYLNSWDTMLSQRFGAIYQVVSLLRDMFNSIIDASTGGVQDTIEIPLTELRFGNTVFPFGGWEVDIIPDGFDILVDALKLVVDIVCTVACLGALRKKFDDLMEG